MAGVPARAIVALLFASAIMACGNDSSAPNPSEDLELSDFDVGIEPDQAGLPGLMNGTSGEPGSVDCEFNTASGRIECEPVTRRGLTFVRSLQFLDAGGAPQERRNANTVSANTRIDVTGTTSGHGGGQTQVNRHSDLTVTGLGPTSTEHTHNGAEQGTIVTSRSHPTLGMINSSESFTHTTVDVVIPRLHPDRRGRNYPLSGTSTRSVEAVRTVEGTGETRTLSHSEVITFNGTAIVPVVLTRNGETKNCERNLQNGRLRCE